MPNKFSILNDEEDSEVIIQEKPIEKNDTKPIEVIKSEEKPVLNYRQLPPEFNELSEWSYKNKTKKTLPNNDNFENKPKKSIVLNVGESENKKKSFNQPIVKKTGTIKLPEYYKIREGKSLCEIPQYEDEWIRRVGALEKSNSVIDMWNGTMSCSIAYYENKLYLQRNKFFAEKITTDLAFNQEKQEELIELIAIQTTAILFHRLIKSDSVETVKLLLKSLPLYKVVSGNPVDTTNLSRSNGANAYLRIKHRYMNDLRVVQNKKGNSNEQEINEASERIKNTETKWLSYVLQSVWNGNNPIHDCLYYGANQSFECILEHYYKLNMYSELNKMMLEPNIQNETHVDIVRNGRKACEKQSSFIIRNAQFEECEKLYNRTITSLQNYIKEDKKATIKEQVEDNDSDGDNVNVYSLINNGDIDGMIAHINRNKDNKEIVKKTLDIWQSAVDGDKTGQLVDYLDDLKFQTKEII